MTNYIRIAADVLNRVFKGNTTYRTSISTQFTVHRKPRCASRLQHSQNTASHFHGFRHAGLRVVSLMGEGGMPLNHHGPPVNSSEYPNIFRDSVTTLVKILLQIVTVLVTQIHVLGLLEILRSRQGYHRPPVKSSELLV